MVRRTTFSLDDDTVEALRRLARLWNTSHAGVIRHAARAAAEQSEIRMTPQQAIASFRAGVAPMDADQLQVLVAQARAIPARARIGFANGPIAPAAAAFRRERPRAPGVARLHAKAQPNTKDARTRPTTAVPGKRKIGRQDGGPPRAPGTEPLESAAPAPPLLRRVHHAAAPFGDLPH